MGYYHPAQICLNGHVINDSIDSHPELNENFCSKCGAKTITSCPACGAPLHGDFDCGSFLNLEPPSADAYCYNCGAPYPWTESALKSTALLLQEEELLTDAVKETLIHELPDIISETPKTKLAVLHIQKYLPTIGRFTADALKQFIIDFGCEYVLNHLKL